MIPHEAREAHRADGDHITALEQELADAENPRGRTNSPAVRVVPVMGRVR